MAHSISLLGVSAAFLRKFRGRTNPNHTTQDVCDAIITPETKDRKCAFIDTLKDEVDEQGLPYVGKATMFVSHAWGYRFEVACETMLEVAEERGGTQYFWFDLFVNNQHDTAAKPHDWWSTTFKR